MNFLVYLKFLPRPILIIGFAALLIGSFLHWTRTYRQEDDPLHFVTFANFHYDTYKPIIEEWNRNPNTPPADMDLVVGTAVRQLMISSFFSGKGFTDMVEIESGMTRQIFAAPVESIILKDLTPYLQRDGLLEKINPPSLTPWTRSGRIFGIPEDVHPVSLLYRADLVEEAGLSLEGVETWDQFFDRLRPMIRDLDGDGVIDRYLINYWPTISGDFIGIFIKQAYPQIETPDGAIHLDSPILAGLMADLTLWCVDSKRVAGEVPMFSAAGWMLQREGYVVAMPVADWYLKSLKTNLPNMAGKFRIMPLPAWQPGGRRTSVYGGTCMTFFTDSPHFEHGWELAKKLHFSRESVQRRFRDAMILSPINSYWDDPIFSEPDPFFGGQPVGEMLIQLAPDVPPRHSSPWLTNAYQLIQNILISMLNYANARDITDREALIREIEPRLEAAQKEIDVLMDRNPFYP